MGRFVTQIPNEDPERIKRVLDAKYRTIGIDKDSLAKQIIEKKEREAAEKERDESFAQMSRYYADQLQLQQQEADRLRKAQKTDVEQFRQTNQLQHTRKEWDLNRPDHKQIDSAARVGDNDPRIGAASMQKFEGEDLSAGDRKAAQLGQAKSWWEEQAAQKAAMKAAEAEAEMAAAELVKYQDLVQRDSAAQEASIRREMNAATVDVNAQLAEERRLREQYAKAADRAASAAELDASLSSPFMTEDPSLAASALSTLRVRRDHFKGMTEGEKAAIHDVQLAQVEEKRARLAAAALEEALYARTQHDVQRALSEQARRVEDFRRGQAARAQEVITKQVGEKEQRDKELSSLYKNKIHDSYFLQFGTSHR